MHVQVTCPCSGQPETYFEHLIFAQLWLLQVLVHFLSFQNSFLLSSPPSSSQFVIRLPRGPLLDFYSKRSWGAVSTPAEIPHRCECDLRRRHLVHLPITPLAFSSSPPFASSLTSPKRSPSLTLCSTWHAALLFWASMGLDFYSLGFCSPLRHNQPEFSDQETDVFFKDWLITSGNDNQATATLHLWIFSFLFFFGLLSQPKFDLETFTARITLSLLLYTFFGTFISPVVEGYFTVFLIPHNKTAVLSLRLVST